LNAIVEDFAERLLHVVSDRTVDCAGRRWPHHCRSAGPVVLPTSVWWSWSNTCVISSSRWPEDLVPVRSWRSRPEFPARPPARQHPPRR